jgi:hypothetical protein
MRTYLRGKVTLLFMMLGMLIAIPAVALADVIVADADLVTLGNQAGTPTNPIDLGTVGPGAVVKPNGQLPQVSFLLQCSGNRHVDDTQTVSLAFSQANSTIPSDGLLSATDTTIGKPATDTDPGIPASWPEDASGMPNCGSTPPTFGDEGNSTVTITAPTVLNDDTTPFYIFKVAYRNSLTPPGSNDSSSITAAQTDVYYKLTVVQQRAATNLSLSANPTTAFYSDNVDLTATLRKTSDSSGISGKTITFKEGTDTLGTATTLADDPATTDVNEAGKAKLSRNNLSVGDHTIKAFFAEDDDYLASESNPVTVTINPWTLNGFFQPVDGPDTMNYAKGGSTVPLKFEVFRNLTELTNTNVVSAFTQKVNCDPSLEGDPIEQYSTGQTELRYDSTSGQFIFNWKTPKAPGSCYLVTMKTQDGSSISASFQLK